MIRPVQSHGPWRQSRGYLKLRWEGSVEKVGFELGEKDWSHGCWEWWPWWWRRWSGKWTSLCIRIGHYGAIQMLYYYYYYYYNYKPGDADGILWFQRWGDAYLNEQLYNFQWGDGWWTRKDDNRWGARGLKRDHVVKIAIGWLAV